MYPHCLMTANSDSVLIFNPKSKGRVIISDGRLALWTKSHTSNVLPVYDQSRRLFEEAEHRRMGLFIGEVKAMPYMQGQAITLLSSMEKERRSLNHVTGWKIPSYINTVYLHFNNTHYKAASSCMYSQIGYPHYDATPSIMSCQAGEGMSALIRGTAVKTLYLCGDIDNVLTESLREVYEGNYSVVIRTFACEADKIISLLRDYPDLNVEIMTDNRREYLNALRQLISWSPTFLFVITDVSELGIYQNEEVEHAFIPVIYDAEKQKGLLSQMRMTLEDIFNSVRSIKDCLMKEVVNSSAFGKISIDIHGNISSNEEYIGNVDNGTAFGLLTKWLQKENNSWMLTRRKVSQCSDCLLSSLCPCVSIYERQGFIQTACCNSGISRLK